jgi:muramoyltetrapeptide carboxypeptidase
VFPVTDASLTLFSPAGAVRPVATLSLALRRLKALGFSVTLDAAAKSRVQRFAGEDEARLQAIHRIASASPSIAMATRGGYGLTRLLDGIDWPLLARSVERGTRWVGNSDITALQLGLFAHARQPSWAGPMAADDWGQAAVDDVTEACFVEAMSGELEAVGFRTEAGFDGLEAKGTLWGGNLSMVCSMLGTRHWPRIKGGVLFLEDVNERPYRVERCLLQLQQCGVLDDQKAVLLGHFTNWKPLPQDGGYTLKSAIAAVRSRSSTPILTGLPFGHVATKVTLPVGRRVQLVVEGRQALVGWSAQ